MNKKEFVKKVIGHKITKVNWSDTNYELKPVSDLDLLIESIELDNGKEVRFFGCGRIDIDDVCVEIKEKK